MEKNSTACGSKFRSLENITWKHQIECFNHTVHFQCPIINSTNKLWSLLSHSWVFSFPGNLAYSLPRHLWRYSFCPGGRMSVPLSVLSKARHPPLSRFRAGHHNLARSPAPSRKLRVSSQKTGLVSYRIHGTNGEFTYIYHTNRTPFFMTPVLSTPPQIQPPSWPVAPRQTEPGWRPIDPSLPFATQGAVEKHTFNWWHAKWAVCHQL